MRWLWVVLIVGCGLVDLPIFELPDAGSCVRNEDCAIDQLCERPSCDAQVGMCIKRQSACSEGDAHPECGCDGVVYWNPCLRRAARESASSRGFQCEVPKSCDQTHPCPGGAVCARWVFPEQCGVDLPGACYVLPDVPCERELLQFSSCADGRCFDACTAIASGQPVVRRQACP